MSAFNKNAGKTKTRDLSDAHAAGEYKPAEKVYAVNYNVTNETDEARRERIAKETNSSSRLWR